MWRGRRAQQTLAELFGQLRRPSKVLLGAIVRPGLRQQDSEVRVRSGGGDQVAGALEQFDRSLVRGRGRGQVAEAMEDERALHLDAPGALTRQRCRAVEQLERAGRVAQVEHDHRQGATDVAERGAVERRSVLHAALEIGPRTHEIVELTARGTACPQRPHLVEARHRAMAEHLVGERAALLRIGVHRCQRAFDERSRARPSRANGRSVSPHCFDDRY